MNLSNIVGSGFIAKSFKRKNNFLKKNNCILYAAGVSNSNNMDQSLFDKDFFRLKNIKMLSRIRKIIYISSCSVTDPSRNKSLYLKKKIDNEKYIKKNFTKYLIIRLPEIIGKNKNKNTLVNFFYYSIKNNQEFILYKNAHRNFIDINNIIDILMEIILNRFDNKTINIASPKMTNVFYVVNILEKILKKKASISLKNKHNVNYKIDIKYIKNLISFKKINFDEKYLINKLRKYKNENI